MNIYKTITSVTEDGRGLISRGAKNSAIFQNQLPGLIGAHAREINSLLNSGKTREQGVRYLLELVTQCPLETFVEHWSRWFKFCSQGLSGLSDVQAKVETCQVLIHLLRDNRVSSELHRAKASMSPTPLIFTLATADPLWNCAALECLWEYLKAAPGPCLAHKAHLEKQMLQYLDEPIPSTGVDGGVRWAGRVYAVLPLPGQGGPNTQGHAEARSHQLSKLLSLAHSIMDYFFEGIIEKESYEHSREYRLDVADLLEIADKDPTKALLAAVTRLINTTSFIAEFITTEAILTVIPQDLLSVVFRILQIETSVLSLYHSQEHQLVALVLPCLHQHILLLLQDILLSVGESVDQYWGPLTNLLAMVSKSYADDKGQTTRVLAYSVLDTLLQISEGRYPPPLALLSQVIKDITPRTHQVKLQDKKLEMLDVKVKKIRKKKISKTETSDSRSSESQLLPLISNQLSSTACVALKLARTTLTHASHSVSTRGHQQLQSTLLSVAESIVGRAINRMPDLYICPHARASLYSTLAGLATSPSRKWPPPYTLIMDLLRTGMADENTEVGAACQLALASVSFTVVNPQVSALSQVYQLQSHNSSWQEEEEDVVTENGQSVPEATMAVGEMDNDEQEKDMQDGEREEEEESDVNALPEKQATHHPEESQEEEVYEQEEKEHEKDEEIDDEPETTMVDVDDGKSVNHQETKGPAESEDEAPLSATKKRKRKDINKNDNVEGQHSVDIDDGEIVSHQENKTSVEAEPKAPLSATKKRKNKNDDVEEQQSGPSLREMLESFVDSDPDD